MMDSIILPYRGVLPKIHPTAFIAPGAVIIGDVEIGEESSVWFNCVIRGDMNKIRVGERTNIQDGTIIHVSAALSTAITEGNYPAEGYPTIIGDDVTIGHKALIHACEIRNGAFVGMGAIVMDGATVDRNSVLAAGSLLPPEKMTHARELWMGNPAMYCREVEPEELEEFRSRSAQYVRLAKEYKGTWVKD